MNASGPSKLWSRVLRDYKSRFQTNDLVYFEQFADPKTLARSLSIQASSSSSASSSFSPSSSIFSFKEGSPVLGGLKQFTALLAVFTASIPDVSNIVWGSISLINERANINNKVRALIFQVIEDISLYTPRFNAFEEVFGEMRDVEKSMIVFYEKVLDVFVLIIEHLRRCSSWAHRIGPSPAPIKLQRGVKEIQKQKKLVEAEVFAANVILQNQRHKEIHSLLSKMQLKTSREDTLPCRIIPYPDNPHFHGRLETLEWIESHLSTSKAGQSSIALYGMGGVGKTQLALKYIYDHFDYFTVILWMQADSRAKLSESCVTAAKQLNLEPKDSDKDADAITSILKNWLGATSEKWLVVYDNADNLDVLKPFWPDGNEGCILITSRDPGAARVAKAGTHVKPLSADDAEALFLSLIQTEDSKLDRPDPELVQECVKLLGYLPLAITQVTSFIVERGCTLVEFKEIYESLHEESKPISHLSPMTANLFYEHTLATVWRISITRLSKEASRLLKILTYLDPDEIPDQLLLKGSRNSSDLRFLSSRLAYLDTISELLRGGLVTRATSKGDNTSDEYIRGLSVHRLVLESVFHQLDAKSRSERCEDAVSILLNAWPTNPKNIFRMNALWSTCALYLPHVVALEIRYRESPPIDAPQGMVHLFFQASWYLYERRMSESAIALLETSLKICARNGNTDPSYPKVLTAYGCIEFEMGHVDMGIKYCAEVVDLYRQRENPRDFLMAASLSDMAWMYVNKDLPKAIEYYTEALEIANSLENPEERKDWSVHIGHNFSRAYIELGQPEKALELQFLHGDEFANGMLSESSQRGAYFLYGIGNAYLLLGRQKGINGAEERQKGIDFHMRALRARNELCGEHYVTALSLHKIGIIMREIGNLEAAESSLEHAARIFENGFAADGEKARTTYHLSLVKADLGKDLEASHLLDKAWRYRETMTGETRGARTEKDTAGFNNLVIYWHN